MHYAIIPAVSDQLDMLRDIGHAARQKVVQLSGDVAALADAVDRGQVWLALDDAGCGCAYIQVKADVDVVRIITIQIRPGIDRYDIEGDLLEHVCTWATESGYVSMSLEIPVDLSSHASCYARHGFRVMASRRSSDHQPASESSARISMQRQMHVSSSQVSAWTRWPAPAKLNLFLRLTGRRPDGYHTLQTVYQLLDRGDEVRLRLRPDGVICRRTVLPGVTEADDLMVRAAHALRRYSGVTAGVDIELVKRIPMGGGLGGGSSDAATVLVALNYLWQTGLDTDTLARLGFALGADVPVFVRGHSAWAEGLGEKLTPLPLAKCWYVVVNPGQQVSTAALFQVPELTRNAPSATIASFTSGEIVENAFEPVVRAAYPDVAAALDWLGGFGHARLSGSGACVFLETRSRGHAYDLVRQCPACFDAWIAVGIQRSLLHQALARQQRGAP